MLTSVDLFTGVAGFTLALSGVAEPVVYCDRETAFVDALIAADRIPVAPIVTDVRDLDAIVEAVGRRQVDIVTAGFPCVGFSVVGAKQGLDDPQSGLFHAAAAVIAALKPKAALFENVATILSHRADMAAIARAVDAMGYDLRWTLCSAAEVGAPHKRNRWFGLATRRGAVMPDIPVSGVGALPDFCDPWKGPVVMPTSTGFGARFAALGNALVPLAARLAFARLYTGFDVSDVDGLRRASVLRFKAAPEPSAGSPGKHGYSVAWRTFSAVSVKTARRRRPVDIAVDPRHHDPGPGYAEKVVESRSPRIVGPYRRTSWPTPRASGANPSHVLSARSACDLSTLALFVSSLDGHPLARTSKGDRVDPAFLEWMMGFPPGWTAIGARKRERPRSKAV